jgi:hypothetical protein
MREAAQGWRDLRCLIASPIRWREGPHRSSWRSADSSRTIRGRRSTRAREALRSAPHRSGIIIFLIDDIGFGQHRSAALSRADIDKLATRLANRFHTTALCSPTRVAS